MGQLLTYMTRPIRSFNIENRAQRVISKEKPSPAPQYPSVQKEKKLADQINPNFMKTHYEKNENLDTRLKSVFVTSTDIKEGVSIDEGKRPLPQSRQIPTDFDYGIYEPSVITEGKCSLRQALQFITKHRQSPVEYSIDKIVEEYKLDRILVENILKHFKVVEPYTPNNMVKPWEEDVNNF